MTSIQRKRNYSLFSLDDDDDPAIQIIREEQLTYGTDTSFKRKFISTIDTDVVIDRIKELNTPVSSIASGKQPTLDSIDSSSSADDTNTFSFTTQEFGENNFDDDSEIESDIDLTGVDDASVMDDDSHDASKRICYRSLDDFRELRAEFLQQFNRMLCPGADITLCTFCQQRGPSIMCLDCFHFRILCQECILKEHIYRPLHRLQYFDGYNWRRTTLRSLGLKVYLGHDGKACLNSASTEFKTVTVIDIKGIQDIEVSFCVCDKLVGVDAVERSQFIQHGWFPATTEHPRTVATFNTLDIFEALSGEGKMSGYHFYRSLVRLRDGTGCEDVPKRYEEFMRMTREYQHIKMIQRAGKLCDSDGSLHIEDGELVLECPACPHPKKNLPSDWEKKKDAWIYTLYIMIDANFRLKSKKKRTVNDLDLGGGNSYFVRDEPYKEYLRSAVEEKEIKYCDSGLRAVDHAGLKGGKGYEASGVVGVQCRHMLLRRNGVGDLQKGEKYANVDYVVLQSLRNFDLRHVTMSYDINCQYSRNFSKRMLKFEKDMQLDLSKVSLDFVIPQFHIAGHGKSCRTLYNLRFREHVGRTDGENIERGWAAFNPLSMASKEMGSGARRDYLNWHFGDWNYQRVLSFGPLFSRKLTEAVRESVKHTAAMIEFRKAFSKGVVKEIEDSMKQWGKDRKNSPNPYAEREHGVLLTKTHRILVEAEAMEENAGMLHSESMSATHWLMVGLELEDSQYNDKCKYRISKKEVNKLNATEVEKNFANTRKIRLWKSQQLQYMPGLTQYDLWDSLQDDMRISACSWTIDLNLPSSIRPTCRSAVCPGSLYIKEFKLREAQAKDSLDEVRLLLQKLWWLTSKKKQHVSGPGQKKLTKSNCAIQVLIDDKDRHVNRYRRARAALLSLQPEGDWQMQFKELKDADLRAMEDDEGKGEGRRTLSWIWRAEGAAPLGEEGRDVYEGLKVEYAKSRARAQRWLEEVQLLREEMRRVLSFFNWKIEWWIECISRLKGCGDGWALGCIIYGNRQALTLQTLGRKFRKQWSLSCHMKDLPSELDERRIPVKDIVKLPSLIDFDVPTTDDFII